MYLLHCKRRSTNNHPPLQPNARLAENKARLIPHFALNAQRTKRTKASHGQSLVEWAITLPILLMLFCGVFDLGRAYFALVMLNNAVSEGAHWAALYPVCLPSASDSTSGNTACWNNNSIVGRIINEDTTLDRMSFTKVCWVTQVPGSAISTTNLSNTNNNTLTLWAQKRVSFVTPVISALFGSSILLSSQVQEVIRGTDVPISTVYPAHPNTNTTQYQGGVDKTACNQAP